MKYQWLVNFDKSKYRITVIIKDGVAIISFMTASCTSNQPKNLGKLYTAFWDIFMNCPSAKTAYLDSETYSSLTLNFKVNESRFYQWIIFKYGKQPTIDIKLLIEFLGGRHIEKEELKKFKHPLNNLFISNLILLNK